LGPAILGVDTSVVLLNPKVGFLKELDGSKELNMMSSLSMSELSSFPSLPLTEGAPPVGRKT
jgi:hypothetical protein